MKNKYCSHCSQHLPLTDFFKDPSRRDGLTVYCKQYVKNKNAIYSNKDGSGVYSVKCLITNQEYIGSSCKIRRRISEHMTLDKSTHLVSPLLNDSIKEHGRSNHVYNVIENCSCDTMKTREKHYIDNRKPQLNTNG